MSSLSDSNEPLSLTELETQGGGGTPHSRQARSPKKVRHVGSDKVTLRLLPHEPQVEPLQIECLEWALVDELQFHLLLDGGSKHRFFERDTTAQLGGEIYKNHKDHLLKFSNRLVEAPQPFRSSASWRNAADGGSVALRGHPGGRMNPFMLQCKLNGMHLLKRHLLGQGQYELGWEPSARSGQNFVDPRLATLNRTDLSILCMNLCLAEIGRLAAEFLGYARIAAETSRLGLSDVKVYFDQIGLAVDMPIAGAATRLARFEEAWEQVTAGRRERKAEGDVLNRRETHWTMRMYVKGCEDDLLRFDASLRKDCLSSLHDRVDRLESTSFRSNLLKAARPVFQKFVEVTELGENLPTSDIISFIPILIRAHRVQMSEASIRFVLSELAYTGAVRPRDDRDRTVIRALKDAGLTTYNPSLKIHQSAAPLRAFLRSVRTAEKWLDSYKAKAEVAYESASCGDQNSATLGDIQGPRP